MLVLSMKAHRVEAYSPLAAKLRKVSVDPLSWAPITFNIVGGVVFGPIPPSEILVSPMMLYSMWVGSEYPNMPQPFPPTQVALDGATAMGASYAVTELSDGTVLEIAYALAMSYGVTELLNGSPLGHVRSMAMSYAFIDQYVTGLPLVGHSLGMSSSLTELGSSALVAAPLMAMSSSVAQLGSSGLDTAPLVAMSSLLGVLGSSALARAGLVAMSYGFIDHFTTGLPLIGRATARSSTITTLSRVQPTSLPMVGNSMAMSSALTTLSSGQPIVARSRGMSSALGVLSTQAHR